MRLKRHLNYMVGMYKARGRPKYFCIGRNKTGTTSLIQAFRDLGFIVGDQRRAEKLADADYFDGRFHRIVRHCRTAQVFKDVPFSYPETFKHIDRAYPGSKFILTVRDTPEQWYNSITRFHAKDFGKGGRLPTVEDLKTARYVRRGFMYNTVKLHGTPDDDPYNQDMLIAHYERHNRDVLDYFQDRPEDLLVLNVGEPDSYKKLIAFLGVEPVYDDFPWEKKT